MHKTAQKLRQKTENITANQSATLVRNMLRMSLSSICYLRYLFPEENFENLSISGVKTKALIENNNPEVKAINEWLEKGVFEAIDKHYLKALIFSIFAKFNDPKSLIESYTFKFTYPNDQNINIDFSTSDKKGERLEFMNKDQIQQAWCTMIRTLITLSNSLPPLPSERYIAMKLYYYEDVTPEDYDPPGFKSSTNSPDFEFITENERIEIGANMKTKYHTVSIRVDTAVPNMNFGNDEDEIDKNVMSEDAKLALISIYESKTVTSESVGKAIGVPANSKRVSMALDELKRLGYLNNGQLVNTEDTEIAYRHSLDTT